MACQPATLARKLWLLELAAGANPRGRCRPSASQQAARAILAALDRVADEPEHRRPQPHEQGPALGVAALVLVDRLGTLPEGDAQLDAGERRRVQHPASESCSVQRLGQYALRVTRVWLRRCPVACRFDAGCPAP